MKTDRHKIRSDLIIEGYNKDVFAWLRENSLCTIKLQEIDLSENICGHYMFQLISFNYL
jgi:hypothetical protein